MTKKNFTQLSKTVSHALRHEPQHYNLKLDDQGWVSLADLIAALNIKGIQIDDKTITEIINQSEKKRFQITDGKIRAYYGHSTDHKIIKQPSTPPDLLYHGTTENCLSNIIKEGLLPMNRQYVHLSIDTETAKIVGSRRKGDLVIITVKAKEAYNNHIEFYQEENGIWLSNQIPPEYLEL